MNVKGRELLTNNEIFDKSSERIARLINKTWLCRYPRCRYLIYDNGSEFKLHFETLCDSYGIKRKPTSVKNPQANAILERLHAVVMTMLRTAEIDMADQVAEMRAFDMPPFPIDFRRAMCAIPVIDEAAAAANAALHADVVAEIEAIEAHIYKKCAFVSRAKEPGDIPGSILMCPKQARVADVSDNSTTDGTASIATIGSVIDPFSNLITAGDMPSFDKMDSA